MRQLQRKHPEIDILRVVDAGLTGAPDEEVLAFAALEGRIVLSRDKATLTDLAYERMGADLAMPGVIMLTRHLSIGSVLGELELIITCGKAEDFRGLVYYIP